MEQSSQSQPPILSYVQVFPLLQAKRVRTTHTTISLDLNQTRVAVELDEAGVLLPDGQHLPWDEVVKVSEGGRKGFYKCYTIEGGTAREIMIFSGQTNWLRTLIATESAPTMLVSGIVMHRIKDTNPLEDTRRKVKTIAPLSGEVLDTATGLGYTAIEAARGAVSRVLTIELDPASLQVARLNPWSRELFSNPRIQQVVGDSYEEVPKLADDRFSRIIHDPPTFSLGGELYSGAFYKQLYRVLKRGGKLFHYIGDLESNSGGRVVRGVLQRLQDAGFKQVTKRQDAFGLTAIK